MEMIKGYESDSASSEASETQEHTGTEMPEVNRQEINARAVRKVYLITSVKQMKPAFLQDSLSFLEETAMTASPR